MSRNQSGFMAKIDAFGDFLQRSKIVSFLMILMVFAAGIYLLWKMPKESDLPQLKENDPVPEDIIAKFDFTCEDMIKLARIEEECEDNYPLVYSIDKSIIDYDKSNTKKILDGYMNMLKEVYRRGEAEKENKSYDPLNATEEISAFVKGLHGELYSKLLAFARNKRQKEQNTKENKEEVYFKDIRIYTQNGILPEDFNPREKTSKQEWRKISIYDEEDGITSLTDPVPVDKVRTPKTAAEDTVEKQLWTEMENLPSDPALAEKVDAAESGDQNKEPSMTQDEMKNILKDFFIRLYSKGNLSYDKNRTEDNFKKLIEEKKKEENLPDILHRKGEILIPESNNPLSKPSYMLFEAYKEQYDLQRNAPRTWESLLHKIFLVAALVVLSWFFILNFHPDLVGNNRTIGLIVFIVIFSMLLNCGIMWLFNRLLLDGRLANSFPLYLAMPFALPALMISALYSGRSAVFAGLFVAGVSAVALDLSFPAFATGLFVCAVSTASVSYVYDYPKFFIRAFVACSITMLFSAIVFYQNPDILSFLSHAVQSVCHLQKPDMDINVNQLGSCLVVPLLNGIVTAGISVVLIMLMVSVLDVPCNMSYLSMIDRNHPLLKKLQMEAPGTYHHSERVALLAEEAANSVGVMSLKAQAFALFHDVGKLASPEMFTENASGMDMFRDKTPEESAAIIRNHVEYGLQLAKKYNLNRPIRCAIMCHHGDDFISFFYEKEKERTGTIPPEEPFRYPGPKPGEIETVILMLADCCEAAVCSMPEPTEENVRAMVEKIFDGKLHRGQLDAAVITLAQLSAIREAFLKTFKSMNHTRISYARHLTEAAEAADAAESVEPESEFADSAVAAESTESVEFDAADAPESEAVEPEATGAESEFADAAESVEAAPEEAQS